MKIEISKFKTFYDKLGPDPFLSFLEMVKWRRWLNEGDG